MATLTIRNIDPEVKQALRERAVARGVSMEEEARQVLRDSARIDSGRDGLLATDLIEMVRSAPKGKPIDDRFARLSQKEISDLISEGAL